MENAVRALVAAVAVVIALQLGIVLVDGFTDGEPGLRVTNDELVLVNENTFTTIDDGDGFDETVRDSRGLAVELQGTDRSFVESDQSLRYAGDGTWTYGTWANITPGADVNDMAAVSWNGRVVIAYNASRNDWVGWYYNDSTRNSYTVNVTATQPGALTNVMLVNNGTHLTIYRNNTAGETVDITASSTSAAPAEDTNWNGTLDETRTFDDALTNSQRQLLVDDPVAPVTGTNRTTRIMYDQPDRSQTIFFANAQLDVSNVEFVHGLDGQVLTAGTDYEFVTDGPKIRTLAGGEVDGAPGVYVVYDFEGALSSVVAGFSSFVGLAALIPLLLIIGVILLKVRSMA